MPALRGAEEEVEVPVPGGDGPYKLSLRGE